MVDSNNRLQLDIDNNSFITGMKEAEKANLSFSSSLSDLEGNLPTLNSNFQDSISTIDKFKLTSTNSLDSLNNILTATDNIENSKFSIFPELDATIDDFDKLSFNLVKIPSLLQPIEDRVEGIGGKYTKITEKEGTERILETVQQFEKNIKSSFGILDTGLEKLQSFLDKFGNEYEPVTKFIESLQELLGKGKLAVTLITQIEKVKDLLDSLAEGFTNIKDIGVSLGQATAGFSKFVLSLDDIGAQLNVIALAAGAAGNILSLQLP
ncbi:MAG: hypothetical protein WBA17_07205, partial [Saprospiraceae bacterium]